MKRDRALYDKCWYVVADSPKWQKKAETALREVTETLAFKRDVEKLYKIMAVK